MDIKHTSEWLDYFDAYHTQQTSDHRDYQEMLSILHKRRATEEVKLKRSRYVLEAIPVSSSQEQDWWGRSASDGE